MIKTLAYDLIREFYGVRKTSRSEVLLMNHIDEGLIILEDLGASAVVKDAYALHPIFQDDGEYSRFIMSGNLDRLDPKAIVYAVEYRNVANNMLLSKFMARDCRTFGEEFLSPLKEVNQMLIADKVQNKKDFELYHKDTHKHSKELNSYFLSWLFALGVDEDKYVYFKSLLDK